MKQKQYHKIMPIKQLCFFFILFVATSYGQKTISLRDKAFQELEDKHYKNSINLYTQLLKQEPKNILYLKNRAYCFHELNQFVNAIADCNKALSFNLQIGDKYYIMSIRGSSYYELEKWQKAFEDLDNCSGYYFNDISIDLARAHTIYKLKMYDKAIKSYNYLLANQNLTKEQTIEAYDGLGFCYIRLDSISKSKEYYKKIISLDSLSNEGLYLYAAIKANEDKTDEAIKCYTKILSKDSNDVTALLNRGIQYTYIEKYDLAIKDLKKFTAKNNNSFKGMYELANAYSGKKRYNDAISYYKGCLKDDPNSSSIHNQISWTYYLSNNFIEGLKYANKAISLDEKNEDAFDTRGCIFYKLNNYNSAIKDFNMALSIDSLYTNSYYYRALCFIKTNEQIKACNDLSKVQQDKEYRIKEGEKPTEILIREFCNK